ncbi:MAG: hypothetical protein KDB60_11100 [Propionibacteriaceae bacterium]|nr:hypothetical protein [Propionibacteriaceae bacterium]
MTYSDPVEGKDEQWQQPSFEPDAPALPDPVTGPTLVPATPPPPPSVMESTLRVVAGVVWPVMIGLVFLGIGNWMLNIIFAIVVSTLLQRTAGEMRNRRREQQPPPPSGGDGQR